VERSIRDHALSLKVIITLFTIELIEHFINAAKFRYHYKQYIKYTRYQYI